MFILFFTHKPHAVRYISRTSAGSERQFDYALEFMTWFSSLHRRTLLDNLPKHAPKEFEIVFFALRASELCLSAEVLERSLLDKAETKIEERIPVIVGVHETCKVILNCNCFLVEEDLASFQQPEA